VEDGGMTRRRVASLALFLVVIVTACSDDTKQAPMAPTPTPPTTPAGANQAPQIVRTIVTPALGVWDLTIFTAHVEAKDADGDRLAYTWSAFQGPTLGGDAPDLVFTAGSDGSSPLLGRSELTVSVTDNKSPAVKERLQFITADLNGSYDGFFGLASPYNGSYFNMLLTRKGTVVTGTFLTYSVSGERHNGVIDPSEPGRVDASGHFHLRFKIEDLEDLVLDGQFVAAPQPQFLSYYEGHGQARGGGHDGEAFAFGYHDPY
jgi:hypothetical protein